MGKVIGVILLVIGLALIYFEISELDAWSKFAGSFGIGGIIFLYLGIFLALIGLGMIIFSRPKQPQPFR
jgi:ABC-type transport system involved in multi-copper enzyme maturation permease subunit